MEKKTPNKRILRKLIQTHTTREIALLYNCSKTVINRAIKREGIARPPSLRRTRLISPQHINRLYWFDELSMKEIAQKMGVAIPTVQKYMERWNIPRRAKFGFRARSTCLECPLSVCMIKVWSRKKNGYHWITSLRCSKHFILRRRQSTRTFKRKAKKIPPSLWRGPRDLGYFKSKWVREIV